MGGRAIPGNLQEIEGLALQSSARYLLVIEKDAIFQVQRTARPVLTSTAHLIRLLHTPHAGTHPGPHL
jgi:DNA topoisomerase VI subunit A